MAGGGEVESHHHNKTIPMRKEDIANPFFSFPKQYASYVIRLRIYRSGAAGHQVAINLPMNAAGHTLPVAHHTGSSFSQAVRNRAPGDGHNRPIRGEHEGAVFRGPAPVEFPPLDDGAALAVRI